MSGATLGQLTGAGTFCNFLAVPNMGAGNPVSYPVNVWVQGRYPTHHVVSDVQRIVGPGDRQSIARQFQSIRSIPLGDGTLLPGVQSLDLRLAAGRYAIQTWSVSDGPINEVLDLQIVDESLQQNVEVWGGGKRLYKLGTKGLGFANPNLKRGIPKHY